VPSVDDATQIVTAFLRDRSGLPDDGDAPGLTLGSIVNLFGLLLRPGEKLLAYADRPGAASGSGGAAQRAIDVVALTDMRMVRSQITQDAFVWKETPLSGEVALGVEAFVGRASDDDPRWWIGDEPGPARFFIQLPESLLMDGDPGRRWEWTATATPWARRPVAVFNSWSEALQKMRKQ
jgi:hypothetical protein